MESEGSARLSNDAVPAGTLGLVQAHICFMYKLLGVRELVVGHRHNTKAAGCSNEGTVVGGDFQHLHSATDSFAENGGLCGLDSPGDHSKLFTPVTSHDVFFSEQVLDGLGHVAEDLIPCKVTVGVVHRFEVVDVDHEQGKGALVALGKAQLGGEPIFKELSVVDLCEPVQDSVFVQATLVHLLNFRVERKLEDRATPQLDTIAVAQFALRDLFAVEVGTVGAVEVAEHHLVVGVFSDLCMNA